MSEAQPDVQAMIKSAGEGWGLQITQELRNVLIPPSSTVTSEQRPVAPRPMQNAAELLAFMTDVMTILPTEQARRVALEIGLGHGGMHLVLLRFFVDVVTVEQDQQAVVRFVEGLAHPDRSSFYAGDSTSPLAGKLVPTLCGDTIDLLFIDGSHKYPDVEADYILYEPLVCSGGIVAFHDTLADRPSRRNHTEVRRFIMALKEHQHVAAPKSDVEWVHHEEGEVGSGIQGIAYYVKP